MSGTVVLVALVVGAVVVSGGMTRAGRGAGGGALYLMLGALIGPRILGLVEEDTLAALRPALHVACGWVGLVLGLRQRRRHLERLGVAGLLGVTIEWGLTALLLAAVLRPLLGGLAGVASAGDGAGAAGSSLLAGAAGSSLLAGAAGSSGLAGVASAGAPLRGLILTLGAAVIGAASGPALFGWARSGLRARGPVLERLSAIGHSDALLTLLALLALTALLPPPGAPAPAAIPGGRALFAPLAALLLGPLLGGAFTLLAGRRPEGPFSRDRAWVLLIGVTLLGAGVATRLGLPAMVVCYLLGVTISATAAEHDLLDEVAAHTRAPVELLVLLLCGLSLAPAQAALVPCLVAVAVRVAAKLLAGAAGAAGLPAGPGRRWAGAGLLGFGAVPLAAALQLDLLYRGADLVGASELVLLLGAVQLVAGDMIGPAALRALLARAGELPQREAAP